MHAVESESCKPAQKGLVNNPRVTTECISNSSTLFIKVIRNLDDQRAIHRIPNEVRVVRALICRCAFITCSYHALFITLQVLLFNDLLIIISTIVQVILSQLTILEFIFETILAFYRFIYR